MNQKRTKKKKKRREMWDELIWRKECNRAFVANSDSIYDLRYNFGIQFTVPFKHM